MLYRRVCGHCHKEFTSSDYDAISSLICCDECSDALPMKIEQIDDQAAPSAEDARNAPAGHGLPEPVQPSAREAQETIAYELRWVGTNRASTLPVVLPDALDGDYVGRDPALCDASIDKPTVSRIQFAYRHAGDGLGIVITNYSQFGTWVNGRLLQRNESAVAPPGSTIEMGGFVFELRERDE